MSHVLRLLRLAFVLPLALTVACGGGGSGAGGSDSTLDHQADELGDLGATDAVEASTDLALPDVRHDDVVDVLGDPTSDAVDAVREADEAQAEGATEAIVAWDAEPTPDPTLDVPAADDVGADVGCTSATHCPEALACLPDGACGPCTAADQCRAGEACRNPGDNGACDTCRVADECRAGEACLPDGACGPCGGEGADCSGQLCDGTACVACAPGSDDAACEAAYGPGFFCNESERCTTSCTDLFDCLVVGRVCDADTNQCVACDSPDACEEAGYGMGTPCIEGVCLEASCVGATACLDKGLTDRPVCALDGTCRACALPDQVDSDCTAALAIASAVCVPGGTCAPGDCRPEGSACGTAAEKICRADANGFWCTACQSDPECVAAHDGLAHMICQVGACAEGCESKDGCAAGQVCEAHRCVVCAVNADCGEYPGAYLCVDGACVDVACNDEKPCEGSQTCVANACVECVENADCPATKPICEQGTCNPCLAGQCGEGQVCAGGVCLVGDCTPIATRCGDAADRICGDENGESWCRDCASDDECVTAFDGLAHMVCVVADDVVAGVPGRCAEGCVGKDDCAEPGQVCLQHRCGPCEANADCGEYPGAYLCVDGACLDVMCNDEKPCDAPQSCIANACVECVDDSACADSEPICDQGTCRACAQGECGQGKVCVSGECLAGDCWIEGQVWSAGPRPDNLCQVCTPETPNAWAAAPGVSCDDGKAGTWADACTTKAGECAGTAYTCPGATCAVGVPHGSGPDDCTLERKDSWFGCLIEGQCFGAIDDNPVNPCEHCNPDTNAWASYEVNTPCGSGKCRACVPYQDHLVCGFVPAGDDPNNDCVDTCQVCNGTGACRWAEPLTDTNNECPAEKESTCGRNGFCEGGANRCGFWGESASGVDDGNECTTGDRCNGEGGKTGDAVVDGTSCWALTYVCKQGKCGPCSHDGECADGRVCSSGTCVVGSCTTAGQCGEPPACYRNTCKDFQCGLEPDNSLSCDDGNRCTSPDYCLNGTCMPGALPNCAGLDTECVLGSCDPTTGSCKVLPRDDGTSCTDGDPCTTESCQAGQCLGAPKCLDDGLACTVDCENGACVKKIKDGSCLIGNKCFGQYELSPENACVECRADLNNLGWSTDDTNACHDFDRECYGSVCKTGTCTQVYANVPCSSDGVDCTVDACSQGACLHTQNDLACVSAPDWTFEQCMASAGGCFDRGWALRVAARDELGTDFGENLEALKVLPDGRAIIGGQFEYKLDFGTGVTQTTLVTTNNASAHGFAAVVSSDGVVQRAVRIGDPASASNEIQVSVDDVAVDGDDALYVAGHIAYDSKSGGEVDFDPGPGVSGATTPPANQNNLFIAKYNINGILEWLWSPQTFADQSIQSIHVYSQESLISATSFGYNLAIKTHGHDGQVLNNIFNVSYQDVDDPYTVFKASFSDKYMFMCGGFRTQIDLDPTSGKDYQTSGPASSDYNAFITKLTFSGAYVGSRVVAPVAGLPSGYGKPVARDVVGDDAGRLRFLVTLGSYSSILDLDPGPGVVEYSMPASSGVIVALDANMNYEWHYATGSYSGGLAMTADGGVVFDNTYKKITTLTRLTGSGAVAWTYPLPGVSAFRTVAVDADTVYTIGNTETGDLDPGAGTYSFTNGTALVGVNVP